MSEAAAEEKQALRRRALAERRQAVAAAPADAAALAADHFLSHISVAAGAVIAGYWPIRREFDVRPLLYRLADGGCRLALPAVVAPERPLAFRLWQPGMALEPSPLGVPAPPAAAAAVVPAVVILPLLAFDADGFRLGYGGGYYDRSLAALRGAGGRVVAVGIGYAAQQVPRLPREAWDQPLDWVITERRAVRFKSEMP